MCLAQKVMVFIDNAWTTSDYYNVFTNLKNQKVIMKSKRIIPIVYGILQYK